MRLDLVTNWELVPSAPCSRLVAPCAGRGKVFLKIIYFLFQNKVRGGNSATASLSAEMQLPSDSISDIDSPWLCES